MFCTLVKIVWNNLCSKNQVKPKSFCIPAVYACRKVTGERGHPLESYKYQFFARPNISRRSHQAPVLQPRNCINLPYTCRGTLRHTCMLRKSCRSFWYENTHTRRSTSSRRGKNKTRIYRVCASTKKGFGRICLRALLGKLMPLQAMAAAVFICLQFFYDTLDSLELNTTRLIFTLMAVKTREPRRLQQITAHSARIKNMTSALCSLNAHLLLHMHTHRGNSLRAQTQLAWESA